MLRRFTAASRFLSHSVRRASVAASAAAPATAPTAASTTFEDEFASTFFRDGIVCIPRFFAPETMDMLRKEMERVVAEERRARETPGGVGASSSGAAAVFDPYESKHGSNEYFMTSGNKVRFFFEAGVDTTVAANYKMENLNKIGHALHTENEVFRSFSSNSRLRSLVRLLGVRSPSVVQSMYIVKAPKIGAAVQPHQDSTWIHTTPHSCIGVWFALDDCDVNNACLTAWKGSHFSHSELSAHCMLEPGSELVSKLHGDLPKIDDPKKLVPIECPKGSVVIFNGQCIHGSAHNHSDRYRHAYVFHVVDDKCTWNERNWLAPTVARLAL